MRKTIFTACAAMIFLQGCVEYREDPLCSDYRLQTFEELRKSVAVEAPREIERAGKIYVYDNLLLVNEPNKGVHVIDNQDKTAPIPKAFINIPGNIDIAVKEGYMYVDSFIDLVVIDIRDINNIEKIQEVNRTNNVFPNDIYQTMNFENYYYRDIADDCNLDTSKGVIVKVEK